MLTQGCYVAELHAKMQLRMSLRQCLNGGGDQPGRNGLSAANAQLPRAWIGKKLDLAHALPQFIKNSDAAFGQGSAIKRRLDALRAAIEQRHTQRAFAARNGLRYDWPRNGEPLGCFGHVSLFSHGHEDVKVARLEPASDTVSPVHRSLVSKQLTGWRKIELVANSKPATKAIAICRHANVHGHTNEEHHDHKTRLPVSRLCRWSCYTSDRLSVFRTSATPPPYGTHAGRLAPWCGE